MYTVKKRHMLLLEVLIAMFIITLCILPLLSPFAMVLKQQRHFIKTMNLDHVVNLLYVDVLDQLQQNKIPWNAIQDHAQIPIDDSMLRRAGYQEQLPYKGTFRFDEQHLPAGGPAIKGKPAIGWYAYWLVVTFVFTSPDYVEARGDKNEAKGVKYIFPYQVSILRQTPPSTESAPNGTGTPKPTKPAETSGTPIAPPEASKEKTKVQ